LIVKKFQNEISIVKIAAQKYDVCRNTIINKSRVRRIMFEFFMNRQLLVSHEEKVIFEFANRMIELSFSLRLFMLKEKVELILREREHETNLSKH
jgi:RNase P/RNase MRP subunit p30